MRRDTFMGLFAVEYQDVPNRGVVAQGGLNFRATEESLLRYFAPISLHVSLNDLIGEAVFWILMPSTIAVWIFPILLYLFDIPMAFFIMLGVQVVAEVLHQLVYIKPLNYLTFYLGNKILQVVAYVVLGIVFSFSGHGSWIIPLAGVFIYYAIGLDGVIMSILDFFLAMFVGIPKSDQLLRLIGWHYVRKYTNDDPTKWTM